MKYKIFFVTSLFLFAVIALEAQTSPVADSVKVFTRVETPASFPGDAAGWLAYLQANLRYPKKAMKKNIQGTVRVQFIVDKEGNISEVMALNDPGGGLAEEAVRIVKTSPNWIPAEQNHRKVTYRHIQSITFALQ